MKTGMIGTIFVVGLLSGWFTVNALALSMPASGLRLWLKADAITTLNDGDPVDSWTDSSGNNYHASNTGVLRPTWWSNVVNGKPAVRFDGSTNYLQNTSYTHGANDASLFIVAKRNGAPRAGYHTLFIGGATSYATAGSFFYQVYSLASTTALIANFFGTNLDVNSSVPFTNTTFEIMSLVKSSAGGTSQFWVDGSSAGSGAGTQTLNNKYWIGNWNTNNPLNGDISEIALYNTALSDGDRQLVEGILAWKYGLVGDLPPAHAWKYTDPTRGQPAITNSTASYNRAATSAALSGYLYSTGFYPTTVAVYWGPTDGGAPTSGVWQYTNTFAEGEWNPGTSPSTNVTLPTPNITYYYRYAATNSGGASWASTSGLFFADARPVITNAAATAVKSTSATLNGYLSYTSAFPVTVSVYWGTTDGGAPTSGVWQYTNTFAEGQWNEGSSPGTNVSLSVPNVTYYYRYYCTNAGGESWAPTSTSFFASDEAFWIQSAAGTHDWTNSANWSPATVPNQAGTVIMITNDRAGNQTINVTGEITLGKLVLGNANSVTLTNKPGGSFRFDNGSDNPRIECTTTDNILAVPVTFGSGSELVISNTSDFLITTTLGGFSNLVKTGTGTNMMTGPNSFTGDLYIKGGRVHATAEHNNLVPNSSWVQLENNTTFRTVKSGETIKGVRGIGSVYVNGQSSIFVIGTNATGATQYDVNLVEGGALMPGFGATVGDLYLNRSSVAGCNGHILGGDIYLDITGAATFDRIMFQYGATLIAGGNLHLNFLSGYMPTQGASWDIMSRVTSGTISDENGGDLFDSIDSNLNHLFYFTAAIISDTTVRVTAMRLPGTVYAIR